MADLKFADILNLLKVKGYCQGENCQWGSTVASPSGWKKIVITESTIRRDLQLKDVEGMDCLSNATIFEEHTRMGYEKISQSAKTTVWNEFSSTMASAIICLAINQKFNFSKYIFESMVKNLENVSGKFLMYPRFVQVFMNQQLGDISYHKRIYVTPSHTKKIFGNIKREREGFSGKVTPLFPTLMVQAQEEMGKGGLRERTLRYLSLVTKRKDTKIPQSSVPTDTIAQDTMEDTIAQTGFENVSKTSNDSLLVGVNTSRNDEDKKTKTAQAQEITSLKLRVKKLEKKGLSRTHNLKRLHKVGLSRRVESFKEILGEEDASKQGRKIHDINADEDITLENVHDAEMFDVNDLHGDEVFVEKEVPVKEVSVVGKVNAASIATTVSAATIIEVDMTLAQALAELKSAKPKADKVKVQDKGKGIMVEEPLKIKKKYQISFDQQEAIRLQAGFDEEDRLVRQREEEANIVSWDNVQAMIDADYQMAQQLQAKEQEKLSIEEKSKLFVQLLEARKKHFAAMRAPKKRSKPPTKAQKRNTISTHLKNMAGYKPNMDSELVKGSIVRAKGNSKRARDELEQESIKKQKVDEDKETTELQSLMEVIPDEEEVAVDAIPLATKPPSIIIRADGSSKMYLVFSHMLKIFDREDLETLWKLVKTKHGSTRPEEAMREWKLIFEENISLERIVGIKRLHDDLEVTATKYKSYNCSKIKIAERVSTVKREWIKTEERIKIDWRIKSTYGDKNALISCDGLGDYDWSDQAEEGPTNFALMAYSSTSSNSEVSTDSNCLESVEARLLVYKKNESVYEEDIKLLKREIYLKEVAITELRRKLELAQKQKDEIQLTVENFENSSKNLSKLLDCQIVDKCKIGLGYNVVPPLYTGNFMPPKPNLSFSGLEEFVNEPIVSKPTVKKHVVETSEAKASVDKLKEVKKNNGALTIED
ncbi:hypothetical protein Tco_0886346 [Tanacetum coccineum]